MSVWILLGWVGFFANTSQALSTSAVVAQKIGASPCATQAFDLLQKWKSSANWVPRTVEVKNPDQEISFETPTDEIGVWIELNVLPSKNLVFRHRTPSALVTVRWAVGSDGACTPRLGVVPSAFAKKRGTLFTDEMLKEEIKKNDSGMIYAWSPHMPLSVQGYPEAEKLAQQLGIAFVPVLDPVADLPTALSYSDTHHFKNSLRLNASIELLERGMNLHYPAVLVFSKGKIAQEMLPGYWDEVKSLQAYVQRELQK